MIPPVPSAHIKTRHFTFSTWSDLTCSGPTLDDENHNLIFIYLHTNLPILVGFIQTHPIHHFLWRLGTLFCYEASRCSYCCYALPMKTTTSYWYFQIWERNCFPRRGINRMHSFVGVGLLVIVDLQRQWTTWTSRFLEVHWVGWDQRRKSLDWGPSSLRDGATPCCHSNQVARNLGDSWPKSTSRD